MLAIKCGPDHAQSSLNKETYGMTVLQVRGQPAALLGFPTRSMRDGEPSPNRCVAGGLGRNQGIMRISCQQ